MIYCNFYLLFILFIVSHQANAFRVDSLLKVMNNQDNSIVISSDLQNGREFIHMTLSEVIMNGKNKGEEVPLAMNNVSSWPVLIEPAAVVLNAGDEIRLKIIRNSEHQADDRVIGISFIPDPEKIHANSSSLQVSVGYKTWLILPGSSIFKGDINAYRHGDKITINNASNKIVRALSGSCINQKDSECVNNMILIPGASKSIDVEQEGKNTFVFYSFSDVAKKIKEITL